MQIQVKLSDGGLAHMLAAVQHLQSARLELSRGLNDAGAKVTTLVRHRLQHQMNTKAYGTILAHTGVKLAGSGGLTFTIMGEGKGLPIQDFPVQASVGSPVVAEPWGNSHVFARSFMTLSRGMLRARRGSARMPIRSLRGPSTAKEIHVGETAEAFERSVHAIVQPTVMARLARLLG